MAERSPRWMYLNEMNFQHWTFQLFSYMCVCVLCFVFCFCFAQMKTLCQACWCLNLSYSFLTISFRQIIRMGQELTDLSMLKGFWYLWQSFSQNIKAWFCRGFFLPFPIQLWRKTHGHTFWSLKFLEDIYWLFLGGNLNCSPPPRMALPCDLQPARAGSVATALSSQAVGQPNGIKAPGLFGLWANTGEQWLVSSASKGTCCFNNTQECFSGVLLPRTFLSGPGPLSWNVTASQPSPWPPPLPGPQALCKDCGAC